MARDDWRIRIELPEEEHAHGLLGRLRSPSDDTARRLEEELEGRRLAVTRDESTVFAKDLAGIEAHFASKRGYVATPWDGDADFEAEVKTRTMATLRCVPLDQSRFAGEAGGRPWALFARAY